MYLVLAYPLQYSYLGNPTEEPGGLPSMGSQSVGHDIATKQQQQIAMEIILEIGVVENAIIALKMWENERI